eukprot:1607525-Amphidinium_carterae.1
MLSHQEYFSGDYGSCCWSGDQEAEVEARLGWKRSPVAHRFSVPLVGLEASDAYSWKAYLSHRQKAALHPQKRLRLEQTGTVQGCSSFNTTKRLV